MTKLFLVFALVVVLLVAGCIRTPPTQIPIPSVQTVGSAGRSDTLVVMLPGRGDRANTFIREGFEIPGRLNGFDTVAVDAHLGYYMQRSVVNRLHEDIVIPARAAGYSTIWLLGISMGGLGSLLYAAEHPDQVDGVILLAPFLGDRRSIETVVETGPLEHWNGEGEGLKDYEIAVWTWLRDAAREPGVTPLILGYGLSDRMALGYEQLFDYIRASNVYTRDGGHKWTTWRPLWDEIAADLPLYSVMR